jgi:hypothetical protein
LRVGCRPLKRKLLACRTSPDEMDPYKYAECKKVRTEMDECYKALNYLHLSMKQQEWDE